MVRDFTVVRWGTDSSGRGIYMTRWMHLVLMAILAHPLVRPFAHKVVVVQGAFMLRNGGGAADSSGVHNLGGCLDIRTWNLTTAEINILVRVFRMFGFALWRRDPSWAHGGMPEHAHGALGTDSPQSSGSLTSWRSYVAGGDGLAGPGRDYEWRPSPLVLVPPPALIGGSWLMANDAAEIKAMLRTLQKDVTGVGDDVEALASAEARRAINARKKAEAAETKAKAVAARMIGKLGNVQDQLVEIQQLLASGQADTAHTRITALSLSVNKDLTEDPDVDGVDNPAPRDEPAEDEK